MTGQCVLSIGQKSLLFNRQFLITQSSIIYTHPSTRHFFNYPNKRHSPLLSLHLCAQKLAMEMAIRSSFTTRLSPRSTSSTTKPSFFKPHQLRPISVSLPTSTISLLSLFAPPNEAKALTISKDQVVSTLTDVEKTIDQAVEFSSSVLDSAQKVFEGVTNSLKPGIDVALPIAKQAGEQAVKIASPAISEASKKAQEAIQSTGIDTEPVLSAAKTLVGAAQQTTKVIEEAKPIASSTVETITSADPVVIVGAAGAVFLAYLLFPSIWSAVSFGLRGYKGEITPAQVLDLLSTKNYIMIDIRSEKDKEKAGIPRLPSSAKNQMVSVPLEELPSKLKGIVRNVKKLEAEIAALKISYLKKINKGSNIVIMDSYSDSAKIVARVLTSLGFNYCWTVSGGFSGGRGWLQSWLGADSYNVSFTEVLRPSRIIPAAAGRVRTASSKLLPGGD